MKSERHAYAAAMPIEDDALTSVVGGMSVKVDQVTSNISTTDGGSLLGSAGLGKVVGVVVDKLRAASRPHLP